MQDENRRRVARNIAIANSVWPLVAAVILNVVVAYHFFAMHQRGPLVWLQIGSPIVLVGALVALVVMVRRTAPKSDL